MSLQGPVWGWGTPFPLVHLLHLFPFHFSLPFIGFTYFLLLSIPSLSTRIVPLRFQAGLCQMSWAESACRLLSSTPTITSYCYFWVICSSYFFISWKLIFIITDIHNYYITYYWYWRKPRRLSPHRHCSKSVQACQRLYIATVFVKQTPRGL